MPELWRLTRTERMRRVYDALKSVGITATRMYEYVAPLGEPSAGSRDPPAGVTIEPREPETLTPAECPALPERRDDETVLVATEGESVLGYLFVSPSPTIHVHPLETTCRFEGAYIRRVFVHPPARNRGVASALVAAARDVGREWELDTAHALVAVDNRPSRWTFEGTGFEPVRAHSYLRLFGYRRRRTKPV